MKIEVANKTLFLKFKLHQTELYISEAYGSRILEDFLIVGVAKLGYKWVMTSKPVEEQVLITELHYICWAQNQNKRP